MQPFDELRALSSIARPDASRSQRTGMPEVILAQHKTAEHCLAIAARLLADEGRALLSRVSPDLAAALQQQFPGMVECLGSTAVVRHPNHEAPAGTGGRVGILTAGTSDIACAEEAALLCRELGCTVQTAYDVGVAGLHRLYEPLRAMLAAERPVDVLPVDVLPVDVLIVAAGMDGALPSVVAGLVDVPVIGLPTAVGYGMGGDGVAALLSMLQSCVPGLAVVNIDNGIGAGAMAARIANRAALARQHRPA